jgi:hypothetical protein
MDADTVVARRQGGAWWAQPVGHAHVELPGAYRTAARSTPESCLERTGDRQGPWYKLRWGADLVCELGHHTLRLSLVGARPPELNPTARLRPASHVLAAAVVTFLVAAGLAKAMVPPLPAAPFDLKNPEFIRVRLPSPGHKSVRSDGGPVTSSAPPSFLPSVLPDCPASCAEARGGVFERSPSPMDDALQREEEGCLRRRSLERVHRCLVRVHRRRGVAPARLEQAPPACAMGALGSPLRCRADPWWFQGWGAPGAPVSL